MVGQPPRGGVRKGDLVEATKVGCTVRGYISGYTNTPTQKKLSVSDARWHRVGQFVPSKVRLLTRSMRLLVDSVAYARW
ncbi:hypothetical protein [Sulfobacillus thermosulfidooxidans]|uniref:hypothetical protein n=1 Tax=Sulfobacillus thermosulfidooxidans TaxID=28034 RepID=UPI0009FC694B|nr:hypothetical protein [Sulfobacillus thermosulfidooxidans]